MRRLVAVMLSVVGLLALSVVPADDGPLDVPFAGTSTADAFLPQIQEIGATEHFAYSSTCVNGTEDLIVGSAVNQAQDVTVGLDTQTLASEGDVYVFTPSSLVGSISSDLGSSGAFDITGACAPVNFWITGVFANVVCSNGQPQFSITADPNPNPAEGRQILIEGGDDAPLDATTDVTGDDSGVPFGSIDGFVEFREVTEGGAIIGSIKVVAPECPPPPLTVSAVNTGNCDAGAVVQITNPTSEVRSGIFEFTDPYIGATTLVAPPGTIEYPVGNVDGYGSQVRVWSPFGVEAIGSPIVVPPGCPLQPKHSAEGVCADGDFIVTVTNNQTSQISIEIEGGVVVQLANGGFQESGVGVDVNGDGLVTTTLVGDDRPGVDVPFAGCDQTPPAGSDVGTVVPARLLDTRSNGETVDGEFEGAGKVQAGSFTKVKIAGRGGVPADAVGVELNITSIQNEGRGFATLYPCTATPPTASTLNYTPGINIANATTVALNAAGEVCVYTSTTSHYALDVVAYVAG